MKIISLKKRKDFVNIATSGKKAAAKGLVLQVRPAQQEQEYLHIGFTASKKIGNAVARNRAKRRLRALVRQVMPIHAKTSYDYVLIGRHHTIDRDFTDLVKDLKFALHNTETYK